MSNSRNSFRSKLTCNKDKTRITLYDIYRNLVVGKKERFIHIQDYNCYQDKIVVTYENEIQPTEYPVLTNTHPDLIEASYFIIVKQINKTIRKFEKDNRGNS